MKKNPLSAKRTNAQRVEGMKLRKELFLEALNSYGTIKEACAAAKLPRPTYRRWVSQDLEFANKVDEAKTIYGEYLEGVMRQRIENPGKGIGGDVLLMFALNGLMPHKYRPQSVMNDESAKEVISEWRDFVKKSKKDGPAEKGTEELAENVEKTLAEILDKRGNAPEKEQE